MKFQIDTQAMAEALNRPHDTILDLLSGERTWLDSDAMAVLAYVSETYLDKRKTDRPDKLAVGQRWKNERSGEWVVTETRKGGGFVSLVSEGSAAAIDPERYWDSAPQRGWTYLGMMSEEEAATYAR